MKRIKINISDIASYSNLVIASYKATKGKRFNTDVQKFYKNFDYNVNNLIYDINKKRIPYGIYKRFIVHDPKRRIIHTACLKDRIIHHALMNFLTPILEKAMIESTFACRKGKGTIAAVKWVQSCVRRYPWFVKIDIKKYFDSIDHNILFYILCRKFKGDDVLDLIWRIICSFSTLKGKGLPIGSLTSQYFANYYLDGLDRYLKEGIKVAAHARYMDDIVWWCKDKIEAKKALSLVKEYLGKNRLLTVKPNIQINHSSQGIAFCGFRILPAQLRLSKRRKKRYLSGKKYWENAYNLGLISGNKLQLAYDSIHAICAHAKSREWRKRQLVLSPSPDF